MIIRYYTFKKSLLMESENNQNTNRVEKYGDKLLEYPNFWHTTRSISKIINDFKGKCLLYLFENKDNSSYTNLNFRNKKVYFENGNYTLLHDTNIVDAIEFLKNRKKRKSTDQDR